MSELNHELDRDNLNKEFVHREDNMARLRFPSKSEHYERHPNAPMIQMQKTRRRDPAGSSGERSKKTSHRAQKAVRRLVELGLTVKKTKSAPSERQRAALADLASKAIDSLKVEAPDDEKASRKRRLKGLKNFARLALICQR